MNKFAPNPESSAEWCVLKCFDRTAALCASSLIALCLSDLVFKTHLLKDFDCIFGFKQLAFKTHRPEKRCSWLMPHMKVWPTVLACVLL